jgi:hypothetical protein
MPAVPVTQEAETGRIVLQGQPGQKGDPISIDSQGMVLLTCDKVWGQPCTKLSDPT